MHFKIKQGLVIEGTQAVEAVNTVVNKPGLDTALVTEKAIATELALKVDAVTGSSLVANQAITDNASHLVDEDNPHNVTKDQIGLGDVPNTDFTSAVDSNTTHRGLETNPHNVTKDQVGLDLVDNTSDSSKPISDLTQTALDLKVNTADIVNTLDSVLDDQPLSANQGRVLKDLVDTKTTTTDLPENTLVGNDDVTGPSKNLTPLEVRALLNIEDGANNYVHPTHVISDITNLQTALDGKVDDSQVLTDVPSGALFTDTVYDDTTIQAEVDSNTTHRGLTAGNPHNVTKTEIGLSNVTDDAQIPLTQKGSINGVAELDASGLVPSTQLPSYVDDVLEFANLAGFPTTGESGKIYIALDTNITYRWSGTVYTPIGSDLALGETSSTAYRGDRGKTAYDHSQETHAPSITERFVTGAVTAVINDALNVSGDCDITLPTANIGESFFIFDVDIAFDTNEVKILQASGITINNIGNEDFQFDIKNVDAQVKKVSATNWRVF